MAADYVSDWLTRLRGRLYEQFKNKPKIDAWVVMIAKQFQDLEDAAQTLLTLASTEDSVGAQLDNLGRVVGQARQPGLDDATYRLYLRARITANRSNGTGEDIYSTFRALFGSIGFVITNGPNPKTFSLRALATLTNTQPAVAAAFLTDAKEAGARANFIWQEVPSEQTFSFDLGPGFDVGHLANALRA